MKAYQIYNKHDFKVEIPPEIFEISSLRGAITIVFDWLIIIAILVVMCHFLNVFTFLFGLFFLGSRQHALAILGHEAAHGCLLKNKKLNDTIANLICCKPLLFDLNGYRKHHYKHHKFTNTDKDPDIIIQKDWGIFFNATKPTDHLIEMVCPAPLKKEPPSVKMVYIGGNLNEQTTKILTAS